MSSKRSAVVGLVLLLAAAAIAQPPCRDYNNGVCLPAGWYDRPSWAPANIENEAQLRSVGEDFVAPILYGGLGMCGLARPLR